MAKELFVSKRYKATARALPLHAYGVLHASEAYVHAARGYQSATQMTTGQTPGASVVFVNEVKCLKANHAVKPSLSCHLFVSQYNPCLQPEVCQSITCCYAHGTCCIQTHLADVSDLMG